MNTKMKLLLISFIIIGTLLSCDHKNDKAPSKRPQKSQLDFFTIKYELKPYTLGETIFFEFNDIDKNNSLDSIQIISENHLFTTLQELKGKVSTYNLLLGQNNYSFKAYFSDNSTQIKNRTIEIWSKKTPKVLIYKIINTYKHDEGAYTQGLQYKNGFLYEGTGQFGKSTIRKVQITNGKSIQKENLPSHQFGEGITIVDDKIYQLTWKSTSGYIYDLNSLAKIQSFYYPQNLEGWGLTYNGKELIMSDGSNRLFFWNEPEVTSHHFITVADNQKTYGNINELEYIDGFIYANIYLQNTIIKIDAKTGEVAAKVDFSNLLSKDDKSKLRNPSGEVLNGIAFNPNTQTFYITGKDWPKLFEVKIF